MVAGKADDVGAQRRARSFRKREDRGQRTGQRTEGRRLSIACCEPLAVRRTRSRVVGASRGDQLLEDAFGLGTLSHIAQRDFSPRILPTCVIKLLACGCEVCNCAWSRRPQCRLQQACPPNLMSIPASRDARRGETNLQLRPLKPLPRNSIKI